MKFILENNTVHKKLRIKKITKNFFDGGSLKKLTSPLVIFRLGARNEKQYCGNIQ